MLVETVTEEADDVVSLTLKPEPGESLPPWRPGAHIDLCLDNGLTRQYSLCGDPRDSGHWTVAVLKETSSRGGSAFVHEHVRAGNRLRVRGPRNHFTLPERDAYLFVAGGIGITPILPMIDEAEHSGADWRLLYGGRTRSSMAFLDRLTRHGGKVTIAPQDTHGLLDLTSFLANARAGTAVMACGPAPLLAALTQSCHGREDLTLHTERFTAPDRGNLVNTAFDVVLARTGDVIHVSEQHTVLSALREHGVSASSSCGEGLCGTCETPVLAGEPEHRDTVLTDEERQRGDTMMICVSRSAGDRLVLDL
ncbi:ferredoxin [Prauserella muralis]|uniref:Ferredoxin n=1 Tax=Prauserella muralis TaxID=588067 RepID=A0A2V4AVR1_9PSEU|nr:PDR/VanB family oxidoreductase [Prauserella muralis]PXY19647.1 ferredoxin [Prauserella muralis]